MKRTALALLTALALAGCGGGVDTTGSASDDAPAGNNRPSVDAEAEAKRIAENEAALAAKAEEEAAAAEAAASTAKFGQSYEWEDGISLTVGAPQPYQRGEYASGGEDAAAHVMFDVTLVNGSSQPFDPAMFTASVQSGNTEADQIFDSEKGIDGGPTTKLLPGREAQFKIAFGVSTPDDVVMEVAPSFEHNSVLFTS